MTLVGCSSYLVVQLMVCATCRDYFMRLAIDRLTDKQHDSRITNETLLRHSSQFGKHQMIEMSFFGKEIFGRLHGNGRELACISLAHVPRKYECSEHAITHCLHAIRAFKN